MDKYYLIHSTKSINSLLNILKTGVIKGGMYVDKKYRMFSGVDDNVNDSVFCSIYFDDLKNIPFTFSISLLFSPKILKELPFAFGKGWGFQPMFEIFKPYDKKTEFTKKLKKIRKYIKNPDLPEKLKEQPGLFHHELFTSKEVEINKYLVGIICYCDDEKSVEKIKKAIKKSGLKNIKLFRTNIPPSYDELFG